MLILEDGALITNNTFPEDSRSGVYTTSTFAMNGGTISNNSASFGGGWVATYAGTFAMNSGTISGNTTSGNGGEVYLNANLSLTKTSGTIYGDTDNNHTTDSTENTATSGNGRAVYAASPSAKKRDTTAGPGVKLSYDATNGAKPDDEWSMP